MIVSSGRYLDENEMSPGATVPSFFTAYSIAWDSAWLVLPGSARRATIADASAIACC